MERSVGRTTRGSARWATAWLAIGLAALLSFGWGYFDWPRLRWLTLPDADDMMRLAQVRDWLDGQGINDWTQYRMAPPLGAPMHWSRVNDVGIAGLILGLTPLVGRHAAELGAVLLYPAMLFACAIFLSARITRRLWGSAAAPIGAILMALAYPGTTVFIPGRIDHHALQVVLIQIVVLMLMRSPTVLTGAAAGSATAISMVIGLETVPQLAGLVGALAVLWIVRADRERIRLAGFAVGLAATTALFLLFLRPTYWDPALCDAFTPASSSATLAGAFALAALAAATPWLRGWQMRAIAGAILGVLVLGATLAVYPGCLTGPYGRMDPFLRVAFLPHIDEANGIAAQHSVARIIALAGVLVAATLASGWMLVARPRRWPVTIPIVAVIFVSAFVILAQVRGAYIGAPLGAPVLAGVVLIARRRGSTPLLIVSWLASAGLTYMQVPAMVERLIDRQSPEGRVEEDGTTPQVACSAGDVWTQLDRYPAGVVMAPTNMASYLVGSTHMATVGAGYHRNNAGNMAMYRFFLRSPDRSRSIARQWNVRYVAFCPGDFDEIDVVHTFPNSLASRLRGGHAPAWLQTLPLHGARMRFYRVLR